MLTEETINFYVSGFPISISCFLSNLSPQELSLDELRTLMRAKMLRQKDLIDKAYEIALNGSSVLITNQYLKLVQEQFLEYEDLFGLISKVDTGCDSDFPNPRTMDDETLLHEINQLLNI